MPRLSSFAGRRVLLLQGPMGPFFQRLARDLAYAGAKVVKVNFNAGDWLFYRDHHVMYSGSIKEWPSFLGDLLEKAQIDVVFLYGDCRPVHRPVFELAARRDIEVFVFEEGYVRGNYITLEKGGVNARSSLPKSAAFYLNTPMPEISPPREVGYSFYHQAWWALLYHAAASVLGRYYPCRTYHRGLGIRELAPQLRSYWRKMIYYPLARWQERRTATSLRGRYFLVPLQVATDSQIVHHSPYGQRGGIPAFIREVIASFAAHAPAGTHLVMKHHPADRGYVHYGRLIRKCARQHGVAGRVHYVHDAHLPTLQDHCIGTVTINSTVGLSSLSRHKPVKVLGSAIYDIPGLTARCSLDDFWRQAGQWTPDAELVRRFQAHLIATTQINGNFYKRIRSSALNCGLIWPTADAFEATSSIVGNQRERELASGTFINDQDYISG